jgi:hypothetical protein
VSRFRFLDINFCAPYGDGSGYFIGKDRVKAYYPYATGPLCHVAKYRLDQIIPIQVIQSWMLDLGLEPRDIATFWVLGDKGEMPSLTAKVQ